MQKNNFIYTHFLLTQLYIIVIKFTLLLLHNEFTQYEQII